MDHIDVKELRRLWDDGLPVREIAAALDVNIETLYRLRVLHNLPRRARTGKAAPDPTVEEIYARAAKLRKGWTPERLAASRSYGWEPPTT
jgi:hypothetical protein